MICERCGHEIVGNASSLLCPVCGTVLRTSARAHAIGSYVPSPQKSAGGQAACGPGEPATLQTTVSPVDSANNVSGYAVRSFHATNTINAHCMTNFTSTKSSTSAFVVEFILSLLGIFGIGWLLAGETVIGFLLLACSILIYWPIMILGTLFTLGMGLMCLGPFAIASIICNALLLNRCLKHKNAFHW